MNHPRDSIERHCREVIRQCLNIAEEKGDHYVAIHKDEDTFLANDVSYGAGHIWGEVPAEEESYEEDEDYEETEDYEEYEEYEEEETVYEDEPEEGEW